MEISSKKKEAYFTATQMQLVSTRFFSNRSARIAGSVLLFMIIVSLFSGFLSPYDPTIAGRDKEYENGSPQMPMFWVPNRFVRIKEGRIQSNNVPGTVLDCRINANHTGREVN